MSTPNNVGAYLGQLPHDYKKAERRRPVTQGEKNRTLAGLILGAFFREGTYSVARLEADAVGVGITGRVTVNTGAGVGGRGGMRLLRDRAGVFLLNRDNVINLLRHLGAEGFSQWLGGEGLELAAFQKWMESLPTA